MPTSSHQSYQSPLPQQKIDSFLGNSSDPFQILGLHQEQGLLVLRTYQPQATKVFLNTQKQELHNIGNGFFELILKKKPSKSYSLIATHDDGTSYSFVDPYQFARITTDFDLHLFSQGTHYELWNVLGAKEVQAEQTTGVLFTVWAPNANAVSVIGNFNSWDGRRNKMRPLHSAGVWEIFIPNLSQNECYKFEIWNGSAHLTKLDPFARYSELRPKLSSIVKDKSSHDWKDSQWMASRNPCFNAPMSVYEVHLGSWKQHFNGDFYNYQDLKNHLIPYCKEMGYTHLQLMPISEHPLDLSWGYQVTGYYSPTARFGTPDELKEFINTCHLEGIGVFLDWVPAHFPKDAQALGRFDGTALFEHSDPKQGEHPHWGTYIFNYGRKEVSNFLISNALYWLKEFHFDGLRVDAVASMLYLDYGKESGEWIPNADGSNINHDAIEFLKHLNSVVSQECSGATMIAEESTSFAGITTPVTEGGIGFQYKWNMGWMNDFLSYMSKEPIHRKHHHHELTFSFYYAFDENFINVLSHDEVVHGKKSLLEKMPGDRWQQKANLRLLLTMSMAHPGKQLSFMGNEFAQTSEWAEDRELHWDLLAHQDHQDIQRFCSDLNKVYQKENAFWPMDRSSFEWIDSSDEANSVIGFIRQSENDIILVLGNFTPVPRHNYRFGVPKQGTYKEVFNSDSSFYGGGNIGNLGKVQSMAEPWHNRENSVTISLPPLSIVLLKHHKT